MSDDSKVFWLVDSTWTENGKLMCRAKCCDCDGTGLDLRGDAPVDVNSKCTACGGQAILESELVVTEQPPVGRLEGA